VRPRLNPFALPSETTLRFLLLVVAVIGTSLFAYNWLFYTFTDGRAELAHYRVCLDAMQTATSASGDPFYGNQVLERCLAPLDHRKGRIMAAGAAGVLALAALLYLAWPVLKRRRARLRPLAPDVPPVAAAVAELSREAGLRREPEVLWNPLRAAGGALAFGTPWRPKVALGAGLVATCLRDRPAFDAILRHELAHLRNGDVATTYFAMAAWWALLAAAVVPMAVTLPGNGAPTVLRFGWRLVALSLLVYLTRNAILRSREAYADVRASVWDGPQGALRRVLDAMPAPRRTGRLRRLAGVHPEPAQRRGLVDAPDGLFRLDVASAFAAGAAAGLAYPSVLSMLMLLTTGSGLRVDVIAYAALLVAPWPAGVLTIAAWRSTQAALAHGRPPQRTLGPALGLAAGVAAGQVLSLEATITATTGVANVGRWLFMALLSLVLFGVVLLFTRWLLLGAEAWLPATGGAPRWRMAVGLAVSSLVLAWGLGQFAAIGFFVDQLRAEGGLALLASSGQTLAGGLLDVVTVKTVSFLALAALWAFPLAAWVLGRRRGLGTWAWLESRDAGADVGAPVVRPALAAAAIGGVAFVAGLLAWRAYAHATVPLAERDRDAYILAFAHRWELVGVCVQAAVAAAVALRARSAGALLGLMAAWIAGLVVVAAFLGSARFAGCVDALTLRPGSGPACPAPMERSFMWTTLKDWVDEGALASLVAIPLALGARWLVRAALSRRRPASVPASPPPGSAPAPPARSSG
jgi:Zn-dependent protease with chaperone function